MTRIAFLTLVLIGTVLCTSCVAEDSASPDAAAKTPSLIQILEGNSTALGGEANWAAVENVHIKLKIEEPGFTVDGVYVASRDGRMRIDIYHEGQRVFAEGLNEGGGWQWNPDQGVTPTNPAGTRALANGVNRPGRFFTLLGAHQRGDKLELVASEDADENDEWLIRLTASDGSGQDYYLDRETFLPTRNQSFRAFHPDVDPTEVQIETVNDEPVLIDGVMRFKQEQSRDADSGEWLGTTTVVALQHNIDLAEDQFTFKPTE